MSKQNLLLMGVGLVFIAVYLLQATGVLSEVTSAPALWNAAIGVLLLGLGAVGIDIVKSFKVAFGSIKVGIETERYEPTAQEERRAIESSADKVTPEQEQQAQALVTEALAREEERRSAADLLVLATNAFKEKRFNAAIYLANQGLHLEPSNNRLRASLRQRLASSYDAVGAFGIAERLQRKAIADDATFSEPHIGLGIVLHNKGDREASIKSYRNAIALDPEDWVAHSNLGIELQIKGDFEAAIESNRQAIQLDPNYAPAHNNLGVALWSQGQIEKAADSFRTAIRLDPSYTNAHYNLGRLRRDQGQLDEAKAAFAKVQELEAESDRRLDAACEIGNER